MFQVKRWYKYLDLQFIFVLTLYVQELAVEVICSSCYLSSHSVGTRSHC